MRERVKALVFGVFKKSGFEECVWAVGGSSKAELPEHHNFLLLPQEHHEEDFFLYIAYSDESVYGL